MVNEFWLWFWRPVAEFIGALALIAAILVVYAGCYLASLLWKRARAAIQSLTAPRKS
jgi:hypothetical protein